jgi:hypothetical protein
MATLLVRRESECVWETVCVREKSVRTHLGSLVGDGGVGRPEREKVSLRESKSERECV